MRSGHLSIAKMAEGILTVEPGGGKKVILAVYPANSTVTIHGAAPLVE